MPLPKYKTYTVQDIYDLPEGTRAELIDGTMYMMAPPGRAHQEIVGELFAAIRDYIKEKGGICRPYVAPFAVFLNEDDHTYVEPDVSVICDPSKLNDKGCAGAPDWIIEVVSPGSQRIDYMIKLFKYRTAGVREYWIVDKTKNRIIVYNFEKNDMNEYTFSEQVPAGIYDNLNVDFAKIDELL
ncbi:Uma2 family endonuclease [Clostridium sp.]